MIRCLPIGRHKKTLLTVFNSFFIVFFFSIWHAGRCEIISAAEQQSAWVSTRPRTRPRTCTRPHTHPPLPQAAVSRQCAHLIPIHDVTGGRRTFLSFRNVTLRSIEFWTFVFWRWSTGSGFKLTLFRSGWTSWWRFFKHAIFQFWFLSRHDGGRSSEECLHTNQIYEWKET